MFFQYVNIFEPYLMTARIITNEEENTIKWYIVNMKNHNTEYFKNCHNKLKECECAFGLKPSVIGIHR